MIVGRGYTHMLGQAAAMLVPFPATFTVKFDQGTFSFSGRGSTFTNTAALVLRRRGSREIRWIWRSVCSGGASIRGKRGLVRDRKLASDRRILITRTVHTPREKRRRGSGRGETGGYSDRGGFHERLAAGGSTVDRGRHGNTRGITTVGVFDGSSSHGSSSSTGNGSCGDTLATSDAVVWIDGPEGHGMGVVVSLRGLGERTRESVFLAVEIMY